MFVDCFWGCTFPHPEHSMDFDVICNRWSDLQVLGSLQFVSHQDIIMPVLLIVQKFRLPVSLVKLWFCPKVCLLWTSCVSSSHIYTRVIQKVSSNGLLRKNKNILQTMYIAIWCTYCTLLFDIVTTIVEALVIALHQFLYPVIVEWCHLRCKAHGNSFFDLVVIVEPPASKEGFKMQE